jgi:hypothetical protein
MPKNIQFMPNSPLRGVFLLQFLWCNIFSIYEDLLTVVYLAAMGITIAVNAITDFSATSMNVTGW